MSAGDSFDSEQRADAAFERLLLDSAKDDVVPDGVAREAWSRFALATGTMASVNASGSPLGFGQKAWNDKVRWIIAGALAGGAITGGWMQRMPSKQEPVAVVTAPKEHPVVTVPKEAATVPRASIQPVVESPIASPRGAMPTRPGKIPHVAPPVVRIEMEPLPPPTPATAAPSNAIAPSTLAAEVLALDELRTAVAAKDFSRALIGVERYHRAFPRGQLAADADALEVEALDARGNHAQAAQRAQQFLAHYPEDPHAPRMLLVRSGGLP